MSIDILSNWSIVNIENYGVTTGIQTGMTAVEADLDRRAVLARAAQTVDPVEYLARIRQQELQERDVRSSNEVHDDELKKIHRVKGLELAGSAIKFLQAADGGPDTHRVDFYVGHDYREASDVHTTQHTAYLGRLTLLVKNGTYKYDDSLETFISLPTGRAIHRQSLFLNDVGEPGIVRYVDAEQAGRLALLETQEDAMRLIAGA
jgi:hypothetical protein